MDAQADDALLEEVLDAWEEGRDPDPVALAARHRAAPAEIERVIRAAACYRGSTELLRRDRAGSLRAGECLKDFEIVRFLGRGGMGEVYRARQLSLGGREVALKVLPVLLQSEASRIRFRRECELLSDLHHPNLAEVYGFGEERGSLFFAMRLIEGLDLRGLHERLRASGPPGAELRRTIVRWIAEVAEGLAAVHAAGLIHRDVKPSNVIVERAGAGTDELPLGRAVLVDFGLVRPVELDTASRTEGSPATLDYASPEQLMSGEVDRRADVFALGVTLHDLLTGRVPGERKRAALGLEPLDALAAGVDRDLVAIVARACATDRRWRYENGAALRDDLHAWLQRGPVAARRRPLHERARRGILEQPARVLKWVMVFSLVVVLVVSAARVGQYVQAAERLQHAYERRDLSTMLDSAGELPAPMADPLLSEDAARLVVRCRSTPSDETLRPVLERLRLDDRTGALLAAATQLRVQGLESDPDVRWYFEGELERALAEPGCDPEIRGHALRLLARLSFERPCDTVDELAANGRLREAALRAWRMDELPELDRLHALSALSGLGVGEDLATVLAWVLETQQVPERVRLGLAVARWILARLRGGSGGLASVDLQRSTTALETLTKRVLATQGEDFIAGSKSNLVTTGLRNVLWEYALIEGGADDALTRLANVLPLERMRAAENREPHNHPIGWLLSVERDPATRERLLEGPQSCGGQARDYWGWGCLAGLKRDAEYATRVRLRCQELAAGDGRSQEIVAAFDEGVAAARSAMTGGILQAYRPDSDTLLGSEASGPAEAQALAIDPNREVLPGNVLAAWYFSTTPPSIAGWSTGARIRRAELRQDERERSYLRLGGFGSSEVELRFRIDGPVAGYPVLVLEHLAARREAYPGHGMVFLDIMLNGFAAAARIAVARHAIDDSATQEVAIPPYMLQLGDNVVTLRLHGDSMSTYRLSRAALQADSF